MLLTNIIVTPLQRTSFATPTEAPVQTTALAQETFKHVIVAKQVGKASSQLTGERSVRVKELNVRVGNRVRKGDIIDKLSTEQLEADR